MLFSYAFTRPTAKIIFRVLRSKSDLKANWSFAPCVDGTNFSLLASKIVGKDIATCCQQESISDESGSYKLDVLLLKADAGQSIGGSFAES